MMKLFLKVIVIFFITVIFTACTRQADKEESWRNEIIKTDKEFSGFSNTNGMRKAFIEYIDDEGILLRPANPPIIGADAIEYLSEQNDTAYTLTRQPSAAQVSASGDLGYSFGVYNLQFKDTTLKGTYVNVWKKDKDGKWKFVLDSGNEGIGNNELNKYSDSVKK